MDYTEKQKKLIEKYRYVDVEDSDWLDDLNQSVREAFRDYGWTVSERIEVHDDYGWTGSVGVCSNSLLEVVQGYEAGTATPHPCPCPLRDELDDFGARAAYLLDMATVSGCRDSTGYYVSMSLCHSRGRYVRQDYEYDHYSYEGPPAMDKLVQGFADDVREFADSVGRAIADMAQERYEDLTSDESVWQLIECNEWDKEDSDDKKTVAQ